MSDFPFDEVEEKIGYKFKDRRLLRTAFVHSSYANERNIADNERMEFLGDAVLETISSEYLYAEYPEKDAGELSKARAGVVSSSGLKSVVDKLDILRYLSLAEGSANVRVRSKKIEANLFEAVLCAIYLDGGMEEARKFALRNLKKALDNADTANLDSKTELQELCQRRRLNLQYREIYRKGPDNDPTFCFAVLIDGTEYARAKGKSIKQAQIGCAEAALKKLTSE